MANEIKTKTSEPIFIVPVKNISIDDSYCQENTIPESRIVSEDLVFTLKKDPTKYLRPTIDVKSAPHPVLKNKPFFDAVVEAEIEEIFCDVNNRVLAETMYDLAAYPPEQGYRRFAFFNRKVDPSLMLDDSKRFLTFHAGNTCLEYSNPSPEKDEDQGFRILIRTLEKRFGLTRSIDGIVY